MAAVGFEGVECRARGASDPKLMRIIIVVPHDDTLIDTIGEMVDTKGDPLPVCVKIEAIERQLPLPCK